MTDSSHELGYGFVKGFDVLGGDLSPDPPGDFFQPCFQICMSVTLSLLDLMIFRCLILLTPRATIASLCFSGSWVPRDNVKQKNNQLILQGSANVNTKR